MQQFIRERDVSNEYVRTLCDTFLGLPFNIASYALLTHILAQITGLEVGELIFSGGDVHLYEDHIEQCKTQVSREEYPLPNIALPKFTSLDELLQYTASDFKVENYQCHGALKAIMS